jgi:hypothetical protein
MPPSSPASKYYPVTPKTSGSDYSAFDRATKQAAELGISRSEFSTRAARRYLDKLASSSLTEQVNDALQAAAYGQPETDAPVEMDDAYYLTFIKLVHTAWSRDEGEGVARVGR